MGNKQIQDSWNSLRLLQYCGTNINCTKYLRGETPASEFLPEFPYSNTNAGDGSPLLSLLEGATDCHDIGLKNKTNAIYDE